MAASFVLWMTLPVVASLHLAASARGALAGTVFVVQEVAFWGGAILAGPGRLRTWSLAWARALRAGVAVREHSPPSRSV